jgi:hypothetical protein
MPNSTSDLYTVVKNISGSPRVFGFLGAHGVRLNDDATYSVPGDLVTKLGAKRSQRQFKALENALLEGDLEIIKSPSVYVLDEDGVGTAELAMEGRVLGTTDPSYSQGADPDFVQNDD